MKRLAFGGAGRSQDIGNTGNCFTVLVRDLILSSATSRQFATGALLPNTQRHSLNISR
jgi:hypothetical protein